ncbi:MAG: RNA polymerase sigma factor [Acidobacteriota bacterium]
MLEDTLEERLKKHHRRAFGWALHCCRGNREEAEEVLQETYLAILEGKASFSGRSSFQTWLFAVIRRKACVARRRILRNLRLPAPSAEAPLVGEKLSDEHKAQMRVWVHQALGRLSRRQREVLHLVFYQQLSLEEAAGVMGVSTGSARTHYHRAKQQMRRYMQGAKRSHEFRLARHRNQAIL